MIILPKIEVKLYQWKLTFYVLEFLKNVQSSGSITIILSARNTYTFISLFSIIMHK